MVTGVFVKSEGGRGRVEKYKCEDREGRREGWRGWEIQRNVKKQMKRGMLEGGGERGREGEDGWREYKCEDGEERRERG